MNESCELQKKKHTLAKDLPHMFVNKKDTVLNLILLDV